MGKKQINNVVNSNALKILFKQEQCKKKEKRNSKKRA